MSARTFVALIVNSAVLVAIFLSIWEFYQARRCGVAEAIDEWRTNPALVACASRGERRAQAYLGMLYLSAPTSEENAEALLGPMPPGGFHASGRRLLQIAARNGSAEAQNEIGLAYLRGDFGLPRDEREALRWLTLADQNGDGVATYNLARMYYVGRGVPRSAPAAEGFLWRSTMRAYRPALCTLAFLRQREGSWLLSGTFRVGANAMGGSCAHDNSDVTAEFQSPTTGSGQDEHLEPTLTQTERQALALRAEAHDWRAARDLTTDLFYSDQPYDWRIIKWARLWVEGNPTDGTPRLAYILSRSCDLADRREAVSRLRSYVSAPFFREFTAQRQEGMRESLSEAVAASQSAPAADCANLSGP